MLEVMYWEFLHYSFSFVIGYMIMDKTQGHTKAERTNIDDIKLRHLFLPIVYNLQFKFWWFFVWKRNDKVSIDSHRNDHWYHWYNWGSE